MEWAIITPIHKKSPRNTAHNHKPVLLIRIICRTEIYIIHNHMTSFLIVDHLVFDVQHGFVKRRYSLTQHLAFLDGLAIHYKNNTSMISSILILPKSLTLSLTTSSLLYYKNQKSTVSSLSGLKINYQVEFYKLKLKHLYLLLVKSS